METRHIAESAQQAAITQRVLDSVSLPTLSRCRVGADTPVLSRLAAVMLNQNIDNSATATRHILHALTPLSGRSIIRNHSRGSQRTLAFLIETSGPGRSVY
ncbi:hypothetical protein J6590_073108 [Homalodisca vitripennis]|nr:hypothetical protein J6590_073108 [Homalodisca vitripennis]